MNSSRKTTYPAFIQNIRQISLAGLLLILFIAFSCGFLIRLLIPLSPAPKSQMSLYPLKVVQTGFTLPPSTGCDVEILEIKVNRVKVPLASYGKDGWQASGNGLINHICQREILAVPLKSRMNEIEILFSTSPSSGMVSILPYDSKQTINLYAETPDIRAIQFRFFPHFQPAYLQFKEVYPSYLEIIIAQKNLLLNYALQSILPAGICLLIILLVLGIWPTIKNAVNIQRANLLLAALILDAISLTFVTGMALGMSQTSSQRFQLYSIPDAVSRYDYGLGGYLFYAGVQADLAGQARIQPDVEVLRQIKNLDRTEINYYDADDKGTGDFALFSFLIFGWNIASLYYGWFALFILSSLIYIFANIHDVRRLFALLLLNLSLYTALFLIRWATNLDSIHDPRIFGIAALPGLLHLIFAMIDRHRPVLISIAGVLIQALLIAFCIHMRSSELWQGLGVFSFAVLVIVVEFIRQRRSKSGGWRGLGTSLLRIWPAFLLAISIGGLFVYQSYAFQAYAAKQLQRHVFWHNFLMGMAYQPEIATEFELLPTDMGVVDVANRYLSQRGIEEKVHWHAPQRYEEVVQELTLKIIRRRPLQVLSLFLYYKPLVFAQMSLYATGFTDTLIVGERLRSNLIDYYFLGEGMHHLKFNPFRPEVLFFFIVGLLVVIAQKGHFAWDILGVGFWVFLWSLLPGWLIYPLLHIVAIPIMLSGFILLAILAGSIVTIFTKARGSKTVSRV